MRGALSGSDHHAPVPATPPLLLPGRTAGRAAQLLLLQGAVVVAVVLVLLELLPVWVPAALALGAGVLGLRAWGRVGDRLLEELRAGYATFTLLQGSFWTGGTYRYRQLGPPWDFRGAWVYDARGRLLSGPDPARDRPGLYPSPSAPGRLEVWTGLVWSGHLRDAPR